jgi:hypothetical protein
LYVVHSNLDLFLVYKSHHISQHVARAEQYTSYEADMPQRAQDVDRRLVREPTHDPRQCDQTVPTHSFQRLWQRRQTRDVDNMVYASATRR